MYTISLCIYADSRMIGPPRTPALGYEFLNKKLIRGSRRMDAVAAKSDAVTAWKCTATDAYRRLQTLTDAYRRWFPVRGFCSFRVWPCQSVPQCDWALNKANWKIGTLNKIVTEGHQGVIIDQLKGMCPLKNRPMEILANWIIGQLKNRPMEKIRQLVDLKVLYFSKNTNRT